VPALTNPGVGGSEMAGQEMAGPERPTQRLYFNLFIAKIFFYVFLVGILETTVHHLVHWSRLVDCYQSFHGLEF